MELLFKYFCFATFLHAAFCELGDDTGEDTGDDIRLDIFSRRLVYISVILAKIARKQKVIEASLNDKTADRNEQQNNLETNSDFTKRWLEDELAVMKKAISSEKEFVRNLVDSLEVKMETKSAVQTTSNGLESRVEWLEKKTVELTISSDMQSKVESMQKTLYFIETTSDGLEDRIESVEKKLDSVETTSNGIESRLHFVESSVSSLILASDRKVSFSAQFRPEGIVAIFKKERIIAFNHVFYNDGLGYNETTGIFIVPLSGVYQFIFFVEGWQEEFDFSCSTAAVGLYIDGKPQTSAVAEPRHVKQNTQTGNAYISYFSKGQTVVVGTGNTCDKYTISGYRTTFSGVLLY